MDWKKLIGIVVIGLLVLYFLDRFFSHRSGGIYPYEVQAPYYQQYTQQEVRVVQ